MPKKFKIFVYAAIAALLFPLLIKAMIVGVKPSIFLILAGCAVLYGLTTLSTLKSS
jgi:hypothetical protein